MNIITIWMLIILLGFGSLFAQTSSSEPAYTSTAGMRQQMIDDAREDPASDLEKRILEDGIVAPDEYEEAVVEFLACMDTYGFGTETTPDPNVPGAYGYVTAYSTDPSTPTVGTPTWDVVSSDGMTGNTAEDYLYWESFGTCSTGTIRIVEAVYIMQIVNPNDVDILEMTIACMVDNDIIAEGELTAEQFDAEMRTGSPNLPFDLMNSQVTSCLVNPAQNGVNGNPLILPESPEATPTSGRMSRAEIVEQVRQNPDSDLETRVLEDGIVTPEEYEEAVDAYLMCVADAGYPMQTSPAQYVPGMYQYMHDSSSTPEAEFDFDQLLTVSDDCSIGTTMNIEAIYSDQIVNPNDVDVMALTVSCLETAGMIKEGELTPEELVAALSQETPDLPFDLWNGMSCLVNPAQNGINGNPLIVVTSPAESTPAP